MARLRDRLPPPNSLVVFEAAARHLSFTRAAEELSVTQAAVSRQIQILEDHLQVPLFHRQHRAITLTTAGNQLIQAVSMGLGHIASTAENLRQDPQQGDVTIASSVTFASYWLMSRVGKFRAQFADIDIRLVAAAKARDLRASSIDLAIRYGKGNFPGAVSDRLFGNEIYPVCAPSYVRRFGAIERLSDLGHARLLHLAQFDRNWVTWPQWFDAFGLPPPAQERGQSFDSYMVLLHAAVRGEGVALCGGRLAEDFIERGELFRPVQTSLTSEFSFHLLHSAGRPLRPAARQFREWLIREAAAEGMDETPSWRRGR